MPKNIRLTKKTRIRIACLFLQHCMLYNFYLRHFCTRPIIKKFLGWRLDSLQLALPVHDQNRLCFLWYSNVDKGDYTVVGCRSKRLPFGLRFSPSFLMLSLYFILILDQTENNSSEISILKRKLYHLFYMDNGAAVAILQQNYLRFTTR